MWNKPEAHFDGDYFFKEEALGTSTDANISGVFGLGCTEAGLRVKGWLEGSAVCASGNTIAVKLQVGNDAESTAATDWTDLASKTVTATGTTLSGELFTAIPETDKKFMRVSVANSTGMTGNYTVAVEYIPR